ncbi:peptidase inhibitor family I36 protein [Streptomyces sp. NBC_00442]|uniref:peptidase inhibitor family I36 protein n=1 Tax=Streptomyces sp. NBC_00442 TaxID=2903651 RepID=UPI002E200996
MEQRFSPRRASRLLAGAAVLGLAVSAGAGQASADQAGGPAPDPASPAVQHQRDVADGKFDPDHLRRKADKEAAEVRDGLRNPDGSTPSTLAAATLQPRADSAGNASLALPSTDLPCSQKICFYYNSNTRGAMQSYWINWKDFAGQTFWGPGLPGTGEPLKNNAASVINAFRVSGAIVYYNSNYQGPSDFTSYQDWRNLSSTYNNNASWHFS